MSLASIWRRRHTALSATEFTYVCYRYHLGSALCDTMNFFQKHHGSPKGYYGGNPKLKTPAPLAENERRCPGCVRWCYTITVEFTD